MILACMNTATFVRCHQMTELLNDYKAINAELVGNPQFVESQRKITEWAIGWETFLRDQSVEIDCQWEGEVDTNITKGIVNWTCPGCGLENHTVLVGPDDMGDLHE